MWPPDLIHRLSVVKLDVEVLIHTLQRPADLNLVLELDGDLVLDERLEETTQMSDQSTNEKSAAKGVYTQNKGAEVVKQ